MVYNCTRIDSEPFAIGRDPGSHSHSTMKELSRTLDFGRQEVAKLRHMEKTLFFISIDIHTYIHTHIHIHAFVCVI